MPFQDTVSREGAGIVESMAAQKSSPTNLTAVAGTADVTYSANEQTMLDDLQAQVNLLILLAQGQGIAS